MRNGSNELFFIIILIMKTQRTNSHDVHWENKPRKFQLSKKDDLFARASLLEETGYEKRQTSLIKTTMLQFMFKAP